ncbi:MAG: hypothetical protein ACT4NY_10270 [Pseudonocardiales bacterium]
MSGRGRKHISRGLLRPRHGGGADQPDQHDSPHPDPIHTLNGVKPALRRHPQRRLTTIADAKQLFGTGQTRTRTAAAVQRAVPFALICQTVTVL